MSFKYRVKLNTTPTAAEKKTISERFNKSIDIINRDIERLNKELMNMNKELYKEITKSQKAGQKVKRIVDILKKEKAKLQAELEKRYERMRENKKFKGSLPMINVKNRKYG